MTHHFGTPRHHHPHRPLHRAHNHTVETLRAMTSARIIQDLDALIRYADEIDRTGRAGEFLRSLDPATHFSLATRQLDAHFEIVALAAYERALAYTVSARVVAIVPVPPHFYEDFAFSPDAVALMVDHHDLPPRIRHGRSLAICSDFPAAQALIEQADVVLFDSYMEGGITVRAIAGALLDPRHLKPEAKLLAHARRHPDPTDIPVSPDLITRIEFI